jgi:drug/metabolite transporter (DMT)-like permease
VLAVALALLASCSWGTSDFIAGLQSRRSTAWTAALGGQLVASLTLIALLAVVTPDRPSFGALAPPLVGGAIGGIGVVLQYRALALAAMSVVSPIIAAAALVPVMWGIGSGERPSPLQTLGIALTIVGIVLISRGSPEQVTGMVQRAEEVESDQIGSHHSGASRRADRAGILAAMGAAVCFGLFLVALDYGGRADPYWTVAVTRTTALLTLAAAAGVIRPAVRFERAIIAPLLVVGLLIAAANITFTSATTFGYLSVVAVLGWLNPAITILWARALLHERLRPAQTGAAVLVFAGIVCLTMG